MITQKLNYTDNRRKFIPITRLAALLFLTAILSCNSHESKENSEEEKIESSIKGKFKGWTGETIFPLSNGQLWKQCSYAYHYHYAYNPKITISKHDGDNLLQVEGSEEKVKVCQITSFSNETVNGTFNGWNGSTVVKLMNGSEWKQFEPHIEVDIEVMPSAILFDDGGSTKLWVEGTGQPVGVTRN